MVDVYIVTYLTHRGYTRIYRVHCTSHSKALAIAMKKCPDFDTFISCNLEKFA